MIVEALNALGVIATAVSGMVLAWLGHRSLKVKAVDRREHREALVRAKDNPDLVDKLNALPPLTGLVLLLLGSGLVLSSAAMLVKQRAVYVAEDGKKRCNKKTCPPPNECVGDDCRGAAEQIPAPPPPRQDSEKQTAGAESKPALPTSWLSVRSAWADPIPEAAADPFERPDASD